jgi:cytochrome d ubiquinol oxidase subunit I
MTELLISLIGFTLLYGVLGVVEVKLMLKAIRAGLAGPAPAAGDPPDDPAGDEAAKPLSFAY